MSADHSQPAGARPADDAPSPIPSPGPASAGRRGPFGGRTLFATDTARGPVAWALCALATVVLVAIALLMIPGEGWHRATFAAFACAAPLLVWIDLAEQRLPDLVVLPLLVVVGVFTVIAGAVDGTPGRIGAAFVGLALTTCLFGAMFVLAPASLGFGDVKLAPSVGLLLGWHGWGVVVLGIAAVFVLGLVHGLVHAARIGRLRDAEVAFGPAMIAATLLVCALIGAS
ncbi:MAG: prepilin peptidase [Brevibacterium yomogidense]